VSPRSSAGASAGQTSVAGQRYALPAGAGTVWLGLGPAPLAGLAMTLLLVVGLTLRGTPLWAVLPVAAVGVSLSAWPVGGRSALQWLPALARQLLSRLLGSDRWHQPWLDGPAHRTARPAGGPVLLRAPDTRPLRLLGSDEQQGLVHDRQRGTVTVVLATAPTGRFGLLDPDGQDTELHRWGSALAALLSIPSLRHLQWIVHTRPDTRPDSGCGGDPTGTTGRDSQLQQDQALLTAAARSQASTHLHLLTLTLAAPQGRRRGGARVGEDAQAAVHAAAAQAATALLGADVLSYPVTAVELAALLRQLTDPGQPQWPDGERRDNDPSVAMSGRQAWTYCRLDDTVSRSWAVHGWPRASLPADWLAGLLQSPLGDGTARTLCVQARPVPPDHAARRARAAAAKARLDTADRQRLGFTPSQGSALDEQDAEQTAAELVAGYPMADLTGLITLHAPDLPLLGAAAAGLRTAAISQRLDLRPLHGQHSRALAACLPLGLPHAGRS
jgi:hypothetical protein